MLICSESVQYLNFLVQIFTIQNFIKVCQELNYNKIYVTFNYFCFLIDNFQLSKICLKICSLKFIVQNLILGNFVLNAC